MSEPRAKLLTAGLLVDGTGAPALSRPGILIVDNRVSDVGPVDGFSALEGVEVIDLGDRTLMPGMIDAHTHFNGVPGDRLFLRYFEPDPYRVLVAAQEARWMLEAGITSARCCGSALTPSLRRAIDEGHTVGPRLVAAGQFVCTTAGGWDPDQAFKLPVDWAKAHGVLADGVDALIEMVRLRIRTGSNLIKIATSKGDWDDIFPAWGDDPYNQVLAMRPEEIQAVISEAHANHLKVAAHAIGDGPVRAAVEHGADTVEHGFGINDETRRLLADRGTLVVTTLIIMNLIKKYSDAWGFSARQKISTQKHIDAQRRDFESGLRAGVRYALGSDLVGRPTHPLDSFPQEFELAVEYGMTPGQAIVAGTLTSAEALGMQDVVGSIEKGKLADIIAVEGNPLADISAVRRVSFVMQGGDVIVNRAATGAGQQ
jgi:imidazolonepropionase-like amidohydrolase